MPPTDPATLREAVATVRDGPPSKFDRRYSYRDATEIVARHFLAMLDAGELVRVRDNEDRQSLGEVAYKAWVRSGDYAGSWPFVAEAVLAAALEPLLPEVRT